MGPVGQNYRSLFLLIENANNILSCKDFCISSTFYELFLVHFSNFVEMWDVEIKVARLAILLPLMS